jgi:hypothetical protein
MEIVVDSGSRRWIVNRAMVTILYGAFILYLLTGLLVGLAFVVVGATRVQAAPVTVGARILLLPGAAALWPFVLVRWWRRPR